MGLPIFVSRLPSGDGSPTFVALAYARAGRIECPNPQIRAWLQRGADHVMETLGEPVSDHEEAIFRLALCRLRAGTAYHCSTRPTRTTE